MSSDVDNKPIAGEGISVCASYNDDPTEPAKPMGCKNFTSDARGIVHFTLPPMNPNVTVVEIEVRESTEWVGSQMLNCF